jgi:SAM-dependent methyltransferase
MNVEEFVTSSLPAAPCRVLEVGCGSGDLARALAGRGYDVTAIDPEAPGGPIFRKVALEEFTDPEPFDAVVASRSLHHIHDLPAALDKIRSLLRPGGAVILNEFGWERMDERTARWYAASLPHGHEAERLSKEHFLRDWIAEHEGLHDSVTMRRTLDGLFEPELFEWVPYLADGELERPDLIEEEHALTQAGSITAIGFRYVGRRT